MKKQRTPTALSRSASSRICESPSPESSRIWTRRNASRFNAATDSMMRLPMKLPFIAPSQPAAHGAQSFATRSGLVISKENIATCVDLSRPLASCTMKEDFPEPGRPAIIPSPGTTPPPSDRFRSTSMSLQPHFMPLPRPSSRSLKRSTSASAH